MKLRAVVTAIMLVIVTSVSSWSEVLWHRYCVLELELSDSACYLTRWLLPRSTKSLQCSGSTAFCFFQRPIQPDLTFAIVR